MSTTYEPKPETTNATGNATTLDVDAFLEQNLGRRYRNMAESVSLVTVYCAIFLTGIAGNVCTCVVIARNKRMHTATNYYLFSLAVSDLLTLVLGQFRPFLFYSLASITHFTFTSSVSFRTTVVLANSFKIIRWCKSSEKKHKC